MLWKGSAGRFRKRLFHGGPRVNFVLSFLQCILADLALSREKRIANFSDNYTNIINNISRQPGPGMHAAVENDSPKL